MRIRYIIRCRLPVLLIFLLTLSNCSPNNLSLLTIRENEKFLSQTYNHFEDGVLFTDISHGLNVLWEASFIHVRSYKENLGYFLPSGLLILPNKDNTTISARFAIPLILLNGKLYVLFQGNYHLILGIIHTHPDVYSASVPAPRFDYQFGHMGIHNYIIGHDGLYDAYKDAEGNEIWDRLGHRDAYTMIPYVKSRQMKTVTSLTDLSLNRVILRK